MNQCYKNKELWVYDFIWVLNPFQVKFEDTKGVIRSRKSKKDKHTIQWSKEKQGQKDTVKHSPRFLCRPTGFFFRLAGAVGRQRTLHTENSGFAYATLPWHISTFRGYRILFSIRNPNINPSPIIFLFIHNHLTLRKWCYTPL